MVGSVAKARVALRAIRQDIDELELRPDIDATKALIICSKLCDVLTMLVEEARPKVT